MKGEVSNVSILVLGDGEYQLPTYVVLLVFLRKKNIMCSEGLLNLTVSILKVLHLNISLISTDWLML